MADYRAELHEAVGRLEEHYAELKAAAQARLGRLYNADDYPPELHGLFDMAWEFPSVEPPSYLLELSPALYEQEKARVAARFEQAVTLAEQAFMEEFSRLVAHLAERLSGESDGTRRVFRDSAVSNLLEFFGRFRDLNVRSNAQLDELVEEARRVVRGVEPQELRDNGGLRQEIAVQLGQVQSALDGLMTDLPRHGSSALIILTTETAMILHIDPAGTVHTIYAEVIDLGTLGPLRIRRASSVEPDAAGRWWADLAPVRGPRLGPYPRRSEALRAEIAWLTEHWLPAFGPSAG